MRKKKQKRKEKKWKKPKSTNQEKKLVSWVRERKKIIMSFIVGLCVFYTDDAMWLLSLLFFFFDVSHFFPWRLRTFGDWNENVKHKMKRAKCEYKNQITTVRIVVCARYFFWNEFIIGDLWRNRVCTHCTVGMMLVIKFMKTEDMKTDVCVCVCGIKLMVYAVNGKCHFEWCQTWLRGTQRINGIHLNRSILRRTGGVESEMGMVGDGMKLKNLTASSCHHTNLWVMQMMLM